MFLSEKNREEGRRILQKAGVIDCHCDTATYFNQKKYPDYRFSLKNSDAHVDLPRMKEGGIFLQFFAVCVENYSPNYLQAMENALTTIECYWQTIQENTGFIEPVKKAADLNVLQVNHLPGALLSLEGAAAAGYDINLMRLFYRLGVRCLSLTWNYRNQMADGLFEKNTGSGLTRLGKEIVGMAEKSGMLLDLAHLSPGGFFNAMDLIEKPPLVSHANLSGVCSHERNLSDEQLKLLAEKGGMVGITFHPYFINNTAEASLEKLLEHFVYAANLVGVEHVGIGSDFDGIDHTVKELIDVSYYEYLSSGLLQKGFLPFEIESILSGNAKNMLYTVLKD